MTAQYGEYLQRVATRMRREATARGFAQSYGHRVVSQTQLRNDGAKRWTLRVQQPLLIPRSRYATAFGVPAGTPEQENQHWVFWHWSEPVVKLQPQTTALVVRQNTLPIPLFPEVMSGGLGAYLYWKIRERTKHWYRGNR